MIRNNFPVGAGTAYIVMGEKLDYSLLNSLHGKIPTAGASFSIRHESGEAHSQQYRKDTSRAITLRCSK